MNEFQQIPGISLSYKGKVRDIYEIKNQTNIFKNFLIWASRNLWLDKKIDNDFYKNCKNNV